MPTKHIDFGFRVARIARRLRQAVDAELRAFGLTEATWRPLAYVGRLGGGVRQKELATALSIEGPTLVRLLDNLERRGLIERREDETDRRARGIYLTRAGRELAVRVAKVGDGSPGTGCWPRCRRPISKPASASSIRSNASWTRGSTSPRRPRIERRK